MSQLELFGKRKKEKKVIKLECIVAPAEEAKAGGEQIGLFAAPDIGTGPAPELLNTRRNYGIRKRSFERLTFEELRHVFYGVYNFELQHQMAQRMNEPEIIALCYAVGVVKEEGKLHAQLKEESFLGIIDNLRKIAYEKGSIRRLQQTGYNPHSTKKGELRRRMEGLDESVKKAFIESFRKEYKYHNHGLDDRNIDGGSKQIYIDEIFKKIERIYEGAISGRIDDLPF